MSFRLHPTKNKKLAPGEPRFYQFEHYLPDPENPRQKIRQTIVKRFDNDRQAEIYDNELKRAHAPRIAAYTVKTLAQLVPDFLDYYRNELERRPRSVEAWMQGWRNLRPTFGDLRPNHVTPELIEAYKRERQTHRAGVKHTTVKKRTIQKELHNLSSLLSFCVKKGHIEPLPFKINGFAKKNMKPRPIIIPTPQEVQKMFEHTAKTRPDVLPLYQLVYYTGLRSEEARTCRVKNVNLAWSVIQIEGKGGKWRTIPIVGPLLPILTSLMKDADGQDKKPDDLLLISSKTGRQYSYNCGKMKQAALAAGITEHITLHVLRKCFASHCLFWGLDLRSLQILLGHADAKTTETYTPLPPSFLADRLKNIGSFPTDLPKSGQ